MTSQIAALQPDSTWDKLFWIRKQLQMLAHMATLCTVEVELYLCTIHAQSGYSNVCGMRKKRGEGSYKVRMRESQGVQESKEASSHLVSLSLDLSAKKVFDKSKLVTTTDACNFHHCAD